MGFDKASLAIDGTPLAERIAHHLSAVASPVVEVGPGRSGLPVVADEASGCGPLVATVTGVRALRATGYVGPALVVACDLPLLTVAGLRALANWPGDCSVVPLIGGRAQTLCARWSGRDLIAAAAFVQSGDSSMKCLLAQPGVVLVDEAQWPEQIVREFRDADTAEDLDRLGVLWRPGN